MWSPIVWIFNLENWCIRCYHQSSIFNNSATMLTVHHILFAARLWVQCQSLLRASLAIDICINNLYWFLDTASHLLWKVYTWDAICRVMDSLTEIRRFRWCLWCLAWFYSSTCHRATSMLRSSCYFLWPLCCLSFLCGWPSQIFRPQLLIIALFFKGKLH